MAEYMLYFTGYNLNPLMHHHSATSPLAGFCMRTTLSGFKIHSGSNASFSCPLVSIHFSSEGKQTHLSHRVYGRLAQLVWQVVPLDQPDTVLALDDD